MKDRLAPSATCTVVASRAADGITDWIQAWNISKRELVEAVALVGNSASRVKRYFEALRALEGAVVRRAPVRRVALRRSMPRSVSSRPLDAR